MDVEQFEATEHVPKGYYRLKGVEAVFLNEYGHIVITGIPAEEQDPEEYAHHCDVMGCGSMSHVLVQGVADKDSPRPKGD